MVQPWPHFMFIFALLKHNFTEKSVGVSGIRTRIAGEDDEHADHLTTTATTGQKDFIVLCCKIRRAIFYVTACVDDINEKTN